MLCRRCPHLVRHGKASEDGKSIEFSNLCGLKMKGGERFECQNFPFPKIFDYLECGVYQETFKSASRRNDVVPTRDFQYSDALNNQSITEMELL